MRTVLEAQKQQHKIRQTVEREQEQAEANKAARPARDKRLRLPVPALGVIQIDSQVAVTVTQAPTTTVFETVVSVAP